MIQKIIFFLKTHEAKIVMAIGFILIAVISFEFGLIQGKKGQDKPLVVEMPTAIQNIDSQDPSVSAPQAQNLAEEAKNTSSGSTTPTQGLPAGRQDCAFVGSKNSDKYHLPTCQWAKRILPKNLVCYKSAQDATAKGKVGDKGCIK